MNRSIFKIFLLLSGIYFVCSLLFASSFVQNRILSEAKAIIEPLGVSITIENIDVSLLMPKIYLNRITLETNSKALVQLPKPLSIERVKVEINPFSLFVGKITLSEVAFYQPKIILENADVLYQRVEKVLKQKSKWKVKGNKYNLEVQKIGVVDAFVGVSLKESDVRVDSGRFTLFIEQSAKDQFSITSNFSHLTLEHGTFKNTIRVADLDIDVTQQSIRANRISIESDWLTMNLKGSTAVPFSLDKGPKTFRASYEIKVLFEPFKQLKELKARLPTKLDGTLISSGNIEKNGKSYTGAGKLTLQKILWDGYLLDSGSLSFVADGKKVVIDDLNIKVGKGNIKSTKLTAEFSENMPFEGELSLNKIDLNSGLKNLKIEGNPLFVDVDGQLKIKGSLKNQLILEGDINSELSNLIMIAHVREPISASNTVISVNKAKANGTFRLNGSEGQIRAQSQLLDGILVADGKWGAQTPFKMIVEGKSVSLTRLGKIQDLPFGGIADLKAVIELDSQREPVISGSFDLTNGEISDVVLGGVKGRVVYQNDLLSFESLELPSLDMIRSHGFVDFKPKETRYKFNISTKRASVDQVFEFFKKNKLGFSPPKGGEISADVTLEGGHDNKGIQVTARGSARSIRWFNERWLGGNFSLIYRDDFVEITRATLTKPKGAVGFYGFFKGKSSKLQIQSYGLKLEDMDQFQGSPVSGEIVGRINLEGELEHPTGRGEIRLIKSYFRGQSLGDSNISLIETPEKSEFVGSLFGNSLQGRWINSPRKERVFSDLFLTLRNCNVTPVLSLWMAKDLPAFGAIRATGDVQLSGDFRNWGTINGSGTLSEVQLDLKTAPVTNQKPISFIIEKGSVKVAPFELSGQDSVISGNIDFSPQGKITGGVDAKVDLLYLQPFIPGLEYGTGRVSTGLRFSGQMPNFDLLGNVMIQDGNFRIQNLAEDFKSVKAQMSLTQDAMTIDRFEAIHGGGGLQVRGRVDIDRFKKFAPSLKLAAKGIGFKQQNFLLLKISGDFELQGEHMPYTLSGNCRIDEGKLMELSLVSSSFREESPTLKFQLLCKAEEKLYVDTDIMQAEWKGDFRLFGDNIKPKLIGSADSSKGVVFFKETKFNLINGNVKFEESETINPRFNVLAKSFVKEQRAQVPIEYEVTLSAYGTGQDYKIRLSSVPALAEPDLIALLVLGVTTRGQDDNYLDFGSTLVGKSPLQSKLQNEFGVDIKVNMQRSGNGPTGDGSQGSTIPAGTGGSSLLGTSVPAVKIQKDITNRTKVSYSSTLDQNALKEFKVEQLLDENFTVNASAIDKFTGSTQNDSIKSYGFDVRYRFQFE